MAKFLNNGSSKIIIVVIVIVSSLVSILVLNENLTFINNEINSQLTSQNLKSDDFAKNTIQKCKDEMHCAVEELNELAQNENQEVVLDSYKKLSTLYHENKYIVCHNISHHLGMWIYGYTQDLEQSLEFADPLSCAGGIFHGVFQNYFMTKVFNVVEPKSIDLTSLCSNYVDEYFTIDMAQCMHGLGHGLIIFYQYDILEALKRCEDFDFALEEKSCSNGIFMGNAQANFDTGKGAFEKGNLHYPCNEVESKFAGPCYVMQATYFLANNDFEVYSSFKECEKMSSSESIKHCYFGIGLQLERDAKGEITQSLLFCKAGNIKEYQTFCLRGMLFSTSTIYLENGFSFCSKIPEQYKAECYDGLGYWVKLRYLQNEQRIETCSNAENSKYFDICMNAKTDGISFI